MSFASALSFHIVTYRYLLNRAGATVCHTSSLVVEERLLLHCTMCSPNRIVKNDYAASLTSSYTLGCSVASGACSMLHAPCMLWGGGAGGTRYPRARA